jgi:hypothetical protein
MPISLFLAIRNAASQFKCIIPKDATVFAVKESLDFSTGLEAYIGYKNNIGNFCFEKVSYEDHPNNAVVRVSQVIKNQNK